MSMRSMKFFGGPVDQSTEAHEILNVLFDRIYSFINTNLVIDMDKYSNVVDLVDQNLKTIPDENSYFWSWMNKHGLDLISKILHSDLKDEDEFLDFLDHRVYILESDVESGINDNVFISIADSLKYINDFILQMSETAAALLDVTISSGKFRTGTLVYKASTNFDNNFIYNTKLTNETLFNEISKYSLNPAEFQQDFCYYMKRE